MRYAYKRLCEGKAKAKIEADLKEKFPYINSRYRRGGYFRAEFNYEFALKLVEAKELESPEKVCSAGEKILSDARATRSRTRNGRNYGTISSTRGGTNPSTAT